MKIIAVNTANTLLSLALVAEGEVLHAYETLETRDQGNLLLRHIQEGLDKTGLSYGDIGLFAVVTGPGSFTGIRIGLAALRALALAAKAPVIGISSFDLYARPGRTNVIALESWREELYFQVNDATGAITVPPVNLSPEDFAAKISTLAAPVIISGDAAEKFAAFVPGAEVDTAKVTAADVARIAAEKFARDAGAERPVPFYLREADVTISTK